MKTTISKPILFDLINSLLTSTQRIEPSTIKFDKLAGFLLLLTGASSKKKPGERQLKQEGRHLYSKFLAVADNYCSKNIASFMQNNELFALMCGLETSPEFR